MADNVNYTAEMTEKLIARYLELGNEGIEDIAEEFGKPIRSIRSKLVQEKVYIATPKSSANKLSGPSKKEIMRDIDNLGFDTSGFDAASKDALKRLYSFVKENKH